MKKIDQIAYDLDMWYEPNPKVVIAIAKVLQKLPQKVYDYVIEKIHFEFMSRSGEAIPVSIIRREKKYIVVIKSLDPYVIAHEIAHSYLGHGKRYHKDTQFDNVQTELEAEFLATKWNFKPRRNKFQVPSTTERTFTRKGKIVIERLPKDKMERLTERSLERKLKRKVP
jgi:hypothetical protein